MGYFGDYYKRNRNIIPLYNFIKNNKDLKLLICGKSDIDLNEENNIIIRKINILYIISSSVLLISLIFLFICNSTSINNFILNYYICTLSFFSLSFIYYLIKFIAIKIIEKNKNI